MRDYGSGTGFYNATERSAYDEFGHVRKSWRTQSELVGGALTQATVYTYDADGHQLTTQDLIQTPLNPGWIASTTAATYDVFGEMVGKTSEMRDTQTNVLNGTLSEYEQYDDNGRLWQTSQGGVVKAYEYDLRGNVTAEVILPIAAQTPAGVPNVTAQPGAAGPIRKDYVRDALGRITQEKQPGYSTPANTPSGMDPVSVIAGGSITNAVLDATAGDVTTQFDLSANWASLAGYNASQVQLQVVYSSLYKSADGVTPVQYTYTQTFPASSYTTGLTNYPWNQRGDRSDATLTRVTVSIQSGGAWVVVRDTAAGGSTGTIFPPSLKGITVGSVLRYTAPSGATGTLALTPGAGNSMSFSIAPNGQALADGTYGYSFDLNQTVNQFANGSTAVNTLSAGFATYSGTFTITNGQLWSVGATTAAKITPSAWQQLDRWGNALAVVDPRYTGIDPFGAEVPGRYNGADWMTFTRYDDQNRALQVSLPNHDVWDGNGQVHASQGLAAYDTIRYYDAGGRLIDAQRAVAAGDPRVEEQKFYDGAGKLVQENLAVSGTVRHLYDGLGREIQTMQANGRTLSRLYDHLDRLAAQQTDGYTNGPHYSRYFYDEPGNRTAVVDGIGGSLPGSTGALAGGLPTSLGGFATGYAYDTLGDLVEQLNYGTNGSSMPTAPGSPYTTAYDYDSQKHKLKQIDGNGAQQVWTYDAYGRTYSYSDLGGVVTTDHYNTDGSLKDQSSLSSSQTVNGKPQATGGQNLLYTYYENGWLKTIEDLANKTLSSYEYDRAGHRLTERMIKESDTAANGGAYAGTLGDARIGYDSIGRITEVRDVKDVVDYLYDAVGNRRRVYAQYDDPASGTQKVEDNWYGYDAENRILISQGTLVNGVVGVDAANHRGVANGYDPSGNRSQSTVFEPSGSAWQQVQYLYTFDPDNRIATTTRAGSTTDTRQYDTLGHLLEEDDTASSKRVNTYDAHEQLNTQSIYNFDKTTGTFSSRATPDAEVFYSYLDPNTHAPTSSGYDNAGNLKEYNVEGLGSAGGVTYTQTFDYSYLLLGGGYKEAAINGTGTVSSGGFQPGVTSETYDANNNLSSVFIKGGTAPQVRYYVNNLSGQALTELSSVGSSPNVTTTYVYANDNPIGSISSDATVGSNFDFNYTPVSAKYPPPNPGSFVVPNEGFTLQNAAYAVFGDAALWYLIADANGLGGGQALHAGQTLVIPNQITNIQNSSSTYQPYDAAKMIGDTTPTLKYLPPPPPHHSCNVFAMIIIAVVVIVAAIFTAGAAAGAFGATVGTTVAGTTTAVTATGVAAGAGAVSTATLASTFAAGELALTGGLSTLGLAAAAVGGAVGSLAGQLVGDALGVSHGVNWGAVAVGGLSAAALAGIGGALPGTGVVHGFEVGALDSVASQGIGIALGQQHSFSWSQVAASAIVSGGFAALGNYDPANKFKNIIPGSFSVGRLLGQTADGIVSSVARTEIGIALGGQGKIDIANVAADAFGNALGNSIVALSQQTSGDTQAASNANYLSSVGVDDNGNSIIVAPPLQPSSIDVSAAYGGGGAGTSGTGDGQIVAQDGQFAGPGSATPQAVGTADGKYLPGQTYAQVPTHLFDGQPAIGQECTVEQSGQIDCLQVIPQTTAPAPADPGVTQLDTVNVTAQRGSVPPDGSTPSVPTRATDSQTLSYIASQLDQSYFVTGFNDIPGAAREGLQQDLVNAHFPGAGVLYAGLSAAQPFDTFGQGAGGAVLGPIVGKGIGGVVTFLPKVPGLSVLGKELDGIPGRVRGWFGPGAPAASSTGTADKAVLEAQQVEQFNAAQQARIDANQAAAQPYAAATIPYKALPGKEAEFARQLAGQEAGLNKLTAGEIRSNIEAFRESGRPSEAAQTIAGFRRDNPVSEDPFVQEYTAEAEGDAPRFAALHEPDMVIGGRNVITGYGDLAVNSSLGAQNRYNQEAIYQAVFNAPEDSFIRFIFSLGDQ